MRSAVTTVEYRAFAELRYRIRHFLQEGDATARRSSLEPQQYLMLLTVRGLPSGMASTIGTLAERLALKHHSAVELIDRLQARGLVRRSRGETDRRKVLVSLSARGKKILEQVAQQRLGELRARGATLADAINLLVHRRSHRRGSGGRKKSV